MGDATHSPTNALILLHWSIGWCIMPRFVAKAGKKKDLWASKHGWNKNAGFKMLKKKKLASQMFHEERNAHRIFVRVQGYIHTALLSNTEWKSNFF